MPSPPFWIIERGPARVSVFGVRPGATDKSWLTATIENALRDSDEFWRETPPADEITASPRLRELGLSLTLLAIHLDDETNDRLTSVAESVGLDVNSVQSLRPWLVGQLLTQAMLSRAGIDPTLNPDEVLIALAKDLGKHIRFEFTVESVLDVFGTLDPPTELEYLRWTLETVEKGAEHVARSLAGWLRGDLTIDEADLAEMRTGYPTLYDILIRDRNEAWIPKIDDMLSSRRTAFLALGCYHLIGEDGVPLLADQLDGRVSRYQ